MPTERGFIYTNNVGDEHVEWGARVIGIHGIDRACDEMYPDALKVPQGKVSNFGPEFSEWFLWDDFVAHDAELVAQGHPSMLVTAGGEPVVVGTTTRQAVNMGDENFVQYWVAWVQSEILRDDCDNIWMGIDNGIWTRDWFNPGTGWDEPYAQSNQEYMDDVRYFFRRVKELAPEIHVIVNVGTAADESQWTDIHENIDGFMHETFSTTLYHPKLLNIVDRAMWYAQQGRVALLRPRIPDDANLAENVVSHYMAYLIVRGDNFFWGPTYADRSYAIPESYYAEARDILGWHTGPPLGHLGLAHRTALRNSN
jgi:hypothetical protein